MPKKSTKQSKIVPGNRDIPIAAPPVAVAIPHEPQGIPTVQGSPVLYSQVPGNPPNTAPVNPNPYLQIAGVQQTFHGQPHQYAPTPGYAQPTFGNAVVAVPGYVVGAAATHPQQPLIIGGPGIPTTQIPHPASTKYAWIFCGIPPIYCGGCGCTTCCIIVIVIVLVSLLLGSYPPEDFLYYRVYEGSSCSGSPIYQYAYPTGTCLTYYEASLSQASSFHLFPNALNTTKAIFADNDCQTGEIAREVIDTNQCTQLASYPGYSMSSRYRGGQYRPLPNSVQVNGYQSQICQSIGEIQSYVIGKCIPFTASLWLKVTHIEAHRSCKTSGRSQYCTEYPEELYAAIYTQSTSLGNYINQINLKGGSGCYLVDSCETTSPYREFGVPDCFQ